MVEVVTTPGGNKCVIVGMMAIMGLTQKKVCRLDTSDLQLVGHRRWCAHKIGKKFYVASGSRSGGLVHIHRILAGVQGLDVDHKDGDGLYNRRENLRPCTRGQNLFNQGKKPSNRSGFKGVSFCPRAKKYYARIWRDRVCHRLGFFSTPEEAHEEYKKAAARLHGEFANSGETK